MPLEYIPLLNKQQELYTLPLGMARFQSYLKALIGTASGHDLELPALMHMNPMAKHKEPP